jgi:group I intron endonuclease
MNNYLIYKHTSPSGKSYIGQTNNYDRRCYQHKNKSSGCLAFAKAIKKYTWDAFSHEILHDNLTIEQANELEEQLIKEHKTLSPNGYNLRTGGLNSELSDESKAKLSLARKGKNFSPETRAKISLSQKGKIISKETKAKISLASKGKNFSPETRAKLSLAGKGKIQSPKHIAKISLSKKANTFKKLKQRYLQGTLTEDSYSATKLAVLLSSNRDTIIHHLNLTTRNPVGHFIISAQQIHDYFNQPNPYVTLPT